MSELVNVLPPSLDRDPVRRALDCLQEGFQVVAFDWRYLYVNPAAARHGRRPAHELVGRSMLEEYPGIEQTHLFVVLRHCMQTRVSQVFENEFMFPDGTARWFELRVQPVPEGICVYSADIDHRKRRALQGSSSTGLIGRLWRRVRGGAPGP